MSELELIQRILAGESISALREEADRREADARR